jgi:hypothetical protein
MVPNEGTGESQLSPNKQEGKKRTSELCALNAAKQEK